MDEIDELEVRVELLISVFICQFLSCVFIYFISYASDYNKAINFLLTFSLQDDAEFSDNRVLNEYRQKRLEQLQKQRVIV